MITQFSAALLLVSAAAGQLPQTPPVRLTHGPMLGHVTSNSVAVWARTSRPGEFQVRYGTAPDKLDQVSAPVTTTADRDNTGWCNSRASVERPLLRAVYAERVAAEPSHAKPSVEDHRDLKRICGLFNFRFQFGSCANQKPGSGTGPGLPAYETMLKTLPGRLLLDHERRLAV
jgi:hypothetical protein